MARSRKTRRVYSTIGTFPGRAKEVMDRASSVEEGGRKLIEAARERTAGNTSFYDKYVYTPEVKETLEQQRQAIVETSAAADAASKRAEQLRIDNQRTAEENKRMKRSNFEQEEHTRSRLSMARKKYGAKFEKALREAERGNRRYQRGLSDYARLARFRP